MRGNADKRNAFLFKDFGESFTGNFLFFGKLPFSPFVFGCRREGLRGIIGALFFSVC
jgi:hypothetical protein